MSAHLHSSVLGIDTHKHTHVAVLLDGLGRHRGQLQVPATGAGAGQFLAWSRAHGQPLVAGVEGTGSYLRLPTDPRSAGRGRSGARGQPTRPGEPPAQGQERPGRR